MEVQPMVLENLLNLYVEVGLSARERECAISKLWGGRLGQCQSCEAFLALNAEVLWDGKREGLVHPNCVSNDGRTEWDEVYLPGYPEDRSVADRLAGKRAVVGI